MDLSVFPRGMYYVKQVTVRLKQPKPFALVIESPIKNGGNGVVFWDTNAFRPDPKDSPEFQQGTKALVLYESVNSSGTSWKKKPHKIPRYIVIGDKWFVNVR